MFIAQCDIKYLATKSSCLVTSPHHYQMSLNKKECLNRFSIPGFIFLHKVRCLARTYPSCYT